MAGASFDSSELRRLSVDLSQHGSQISTTIRPIVKRGANNIKKQMVDEMKSSTHFKSAAGDITYEVKAERDAVEAQIGPEDGGLANIAYFGAEQGVYRAGPRWSQIAYYGASKGGGTVPDPQLALEAEMPNFERFINAAIEGSL